MFWNMTWVQEKVSEDRKPAGMVLKDCKRQRAEPGTVMPALLLRAADRLKCPQNWAQVLGFGKEIGGSFCKTVQGYTVSLIVRVHQEKYNKDWVMQLFTRLEICSVANVLTQGHFITFLHSWIEGAWSGWWGAEPGLCLLPHQSSTRERGCALSPVKVGTFPWRVVGEIPCGEHRNKFSLYPRGTSPEQFWAPADLCCSQTEQTPFFMLCILTHLSQESRDV